MERLRLLVGGPISEWPDELAQGTLVGPWAAADRGAHRLLALGHVPVLTVGDFDSMTPSEREQTLAQLPRVVSAKPEIYGATGGRLDQLLSNIWIFTQPRFQQLATKVVLIDRTNRVSFYLPGTHTITHTPGMKYLGFMPLTPVTGLTLIDEKYKLTNWQGNPFSFSSNEFDGDVNHFSFESGMVAVIESRDLTGQTGD